VNLRFSSVLILSVGLHFLSGCGVFKADPHIAFLGDSITQLWWYPAVNLGYHGDTTERILNRYPLAVPDHGYTSVVILAGTNDILLGIDSNITIQNLEKLGELTVEQHAEPVLCEIPPIFHGWPGDTRDHKPKVLELNRRIAQLAVEHHWKLVDYYTPLASHPGYFSDGIHPTRFGYLVMIRTFRRTLSHSHRGD
jgi:lysophospholipase L1-like esterase